ncbi:MAG: hypothetical protein KGL25_00355 [Gammaproteobacteria bacterium]|nr:hypothetical protein [Gammaproteobacteria bacterium]
MTGFNPADPSIQYVDTSRNGQSDGPAEMRDKVAALTLDFSRDFGSSTQFIDGQLAITTSENNTAGGHREGVEFT